MSNFASFASFVFDSFVKGGSTFLRSLAMGSLQCGGVVYSAQLPQLSPNLSPPLPNIREGDKKQIFTTLSAGTL